MSPNKNIKSQRYVITPDNITGAGDGLKLQQVIGPNQPICIYSSTIAVGTKGLERHSLSYNKKTHVYNNATEYRIWDADRIYEWQSVCDYRHIFVVKLDGSNATGTVYKNTAELKDECHKLFKKWLIVYFSEVLKH